MIERTGYKRRTFEEIVNAKIAKAKELFGEAINTDGNTALGKYILINAYDQYQVEELAEQIYYAINPQTAFGQSLDRLSWILGMKRNPATAATYKVKVRGTAGATVEKGFLVGVNLDYVGSDADLTFSNIEKAVIGEAGECEIIVACTTTGLIGNVAPAIINRIVNPTSTIDTVEGISVVDAAKGEESDYEYRKRYELARDGKGSGTVAAITAALMNIPTVRSAYVDVNESATETIKGVPPKAIACYVDGGIGREQEIAETIFNKKPIGVSTHGAETVKVSYGALKDYEVKFSYSESVNVYVKLTLTTNEKYGVDGNSTIKNNIATIINSLGMSEPLITTALYGDIYKVAGVVSAFVEVSTDGVTYSTNNIEVATNQQCVLNALTINGVTV